MISVTLLPSRSFDGYVSRLSVCLSYSFPVPRFATSERKKRNETKLKPNKTLLVCTNTEPFQIQCIHPASRLGYVQQHCLNYRSYIASNEMPVWEFGKVWNKTAMACFEGFPLHFGKVRETEVFMVSCCLIQTRTGYFLHNCIITITVSNSWNRLYPT